MSIYDDEFGENRNPIQMIYLRLGDNLCAARRNRKLTQEQLAELVGLERTSISNIENGRQRIQIHTLYALALKLNVKPQDLLPEPGLTDKKFRNQMPEDLTPGERQWVEDILALEGQVLNFRESESIDLTEIRNARDLLNQAGVTEPPVPIERIAQYVGFQIRSVPYKGDIAGLVYDVSSDHIIGVNSFHSEARQRFMIAYALGQLMWDRPDKLCITRNFRFPTKSRSILKNIGEPEREATRFAIDLLMPGTMLNNDLKNHKVDLEDDEFLRRMAKRYQVSSQVMTLRLAGTWPRF